MMKKLTLTTLVLLIAMVVISTTSSAGNAAELPAQDGRIWAPTEDLVGLENHATLGFVSWDPNGNQPKFAEDWQQTDNFIYNGLFGYNTVLNNGRSIIVRGYGESDGNGTTTRLTLSTSVPDRCRVTMDFRTATNFYDVTSEMRAVGFSAPPAPPALADQPAMDWRIGKVTFAYDLGKGFGIDLGFNQMHKKGNKGSLLRGATGNAVPGTKTFDNTTNEFLLGVNYRGTSFDVAANGLYRQSDNDRALGEHTYSEDQTYYRAGLAATYRLNGKTNVLGAISTGKLETENQENWNSQAYSPNGESKTTNGRLAFITSFGSSTTARLTAGFGSWTTDYQTDIAGVIEQATSRERTSTDAGLLVTNTSFNKTRLRLDYRFRATKLEDAVALDNLPGDGNGDSQTIDQDRISQRASLSASTRVGRKTTLKARLNYRYLTVDQANHWVGNELFYTMGDRTQNRFGGRVSVQTRPSTKTRLDLGFQAHSQYFERNDIEDVKTTNSATQVFMGLNVLASDRLTFVGTGSYGMEKYEIEDGPVSGAGMGPLTYEGKTLRFAPGLIFQVMDKMQLEAHYEGVRFEDPGDALDGGNQLNSDLDRVLARASYQVGKAMKVTATYRRHEFDENRWDDYIMDLYSLSLSGKF
jgi:hypothetical protein